MNLTRYLVQARGISSGDSSHRVARQAIIARNLDELNQKLHKQYEYDILALEPISRNDPLNCEYDNHEFLVMFGIGKCTVCGLQKPFGDNE